MTVGETNMTDSSAVAVKKPPRHKTPAKRANLLSGSQWLQHSFSIWRGLGKTSAERKIGHPAMFPVSLVSRILDAYTRCEGVLLDPFAGSGSALEAALAKGMDVVGVDINRHFYDIFKERAAPLSSSQWCYIVGDARHLRALLPPDSADVCITSPPYWDILNRKRSADGKNARSYSSLADDMGNVKLYREFLDCLGDVFAGVRSVLKPGAPFVLNVADLRKGPVFYPLHMDAAEEARRHGFVLEDIIVWDRQSDYNNQRPLGYPYKFIINKVHEYLLVLR
ncbi:MAG: DNA methyltransferase [Gammaproteobacteria bacterium]